MLKVGLTGGIGSGKSTVVAIFNTLGVPVYIADQRAQVVMHENANLRDAIIDLLSPAAYSTTGALDRKFVASKVFEDRTLLARLNAIVHPQVREDFEAWCETMQEEHAYVIHEAAILFESGVVALMDEVILVWAPEELRITRIMSRDNATREEILARMDNQWPENEKAARAQFILINDEVHSLINQVRDIDATLQYIAAYKEVTPSMSPQEIAGKLRAMKSR